MLVDRPNGVPISAVLAPPVLILSISSQAPPSPSVGDTYIVPIAATGVWSGQDNNIAAWSGQWSFTMPAKGWQSYVDDVDGYYFFNGSAWTLLGAASGGGGSTIISGEANAELSVPVSQYQFDLTIKAAELTYITKSSNIVAADITSESGFTLTDPNNITDGLPFFSTSVGLRVVNIGQGIGTGNATLEWLWNGVPFTLNLDKL